MLLNSHRVPAYWSELWSAAQVQANRLRGRAPLIVTAATQLSLTRLDRGGRVIICLGKTLEVYYLILIHFNCTCKVLLLSMLSALFFNLRLFDAGP